MSEEKKSAFLLTAPKTFKIGDTADCLLDDKEAVRVTWRDATTLVIEPDDVRGIIQVTHDDEGIHFIGGDKGEDVTFTRVQRRESDDADDTQEPDDFYINRGEPPSTETTAMTAVLIAPPDELFQVFSRLHDMSICWVARGRKPSWQWTDITISHEVDFMAAHDAINELFTREEAQALVEHLADYSREVRAERVALPIDLERHCDQPSPLCWIDVPDQQDLPISGLRVIGYVGPR